MDSENGDENLIMKKENLRLIFIGAGNIAQSTVKGLLLKCSYVESKQILVFAPSNRNMNIFKNFGCHTTNKLEEIFFDYSKKIFYLMFICVKPKIAHNEEFWKLTINKGNPINKEKNKLLIISMVAGISSSFIDQMLNKCYYNVRIMPNTAIEINYGTIGLYWSIKDELFNRLWYNEIMDLLNKLGNVIVIDDEEQLHTVTAITGSGIAFIYTIIQALSDGGVASGLTRKISRKLVANTVMGAAKMIMETELNPIELRDRVCSPSGTTIAGIEILEKGSINSILIDAVKCSTARSKELAEENKKKSE